MTAETMPLTSTAAEHGGDDDEQQIVPGVERGNANQQGEDQIDQAFAGDLIIQRVANPAGHHAARQIRNGETATTPASSRREAKTAVASASPASREAVESKAEANASASPKMAIKNVPRRRDRRREALPKLLAQTHEVIMTLTAPGPCPDPGWRNSPHFRKCSSSLRRSL